MSDRILNITYILIFLCLSVFIGICHEPYANEAQSFLIARETSIPRYITDIARKQGCPMLLFLWLKLLLAYRKDIEI